MCATIETRTEEVQYYCYFRRKCRTDKELTDDGDDRGGGGEMCRDNTFIIITTRVMTDVIEYATE